MTEKLEVLAGMEYPGRFIIAGRSADDKYLVVSYGLTGRSDPSKARKFVHEEQTHTIRTDVTDPAVLNKGSPALLLYPAIAVHNGAVVASNGAQTKLIYSALRNVSNLRRTGPHNIMDKAMKDPFYEYDSKDKRWIDITTFEPDAPNNTPRINLVAFPHLALFNIVKEREGNKESLYQMWSTNKGEGQFISTYRGDNVNPLPAFEGNTVPVQIIGTNPQETNDSIFESLNPAVRVAVATVYVNGEDIQTSLRSIHD